METYTTLRATDPEYGTKIELFLAQHLPTVRLPSGTVLDAVTEAFLSTSQHRYGPRPSPENLVELRKVMKLWMDIGQPIPILVPWGSKKAHGATPDVAEVMALKVIECLKERVEAFYPPSVHVVLNIEDVGGKYTRATEPDFIKQSNEIDSYADSMKRLVVATGNGRWLEAIPESRSVDWAAFFGYAAYNVEPVLQDAIYEVFTDGAPQEDTQAALRKIGWKGDLPIEQIQFYMQRYAKIYPGLTDVQKMKILGRYLAQAFTRYQLNSKVFYYKEWRDNYINLNFSAPVPGMPTTLANRRLYYRTIPTKFTENHMPAWRAKGYVVITENGDVTPKLAHWGDERPYHKNAVLLQGFGTTVEVDADYILTE